MANICSEEQLSNCPIRRTVSNLYGEFYNLNFCQNKASKIIMYIMQGMVFVLVCLNNIWYRAKNTTIILLIDKDINLVIAYLPLSPPFHRYLFSSKNNNDLPAFK